jgi:peptidoglycan/LPS O-acetylase OafA/YrhL
MKIAHRPDIDGLRAVAVIAILLFHFDERWLPGGFVGVDIFFVISGSLITSLIIGERSVGAPASA